MRQISQSALQAMLSEDSQAVPITILEIDHPERATPLRFCNNNENITHQGNEYQWYPFEVTLPSSTNSDEQIKTQIAISNIDQSIIAFLRTIKTRPTITLSVVYLAEDQQDPPETDTKEFGPIELVYKKQQSNAETITGTIEYEADFLNQIFLSQSFNPSTAAGIFK